MKLEVKRKILSSNNVIGELWIDNKFKCYTLEDIPRDKKVQNQTCIPSGSYSVVVNLSNHFKKRLPLIFNQKDLSVKATNGDIWQGVRFHGGNTEADTEGCILVAYNKDTTKHTIYGSASNDLVKILDNGITHTLNITNDY